MLPRLIGEEPGRPSQYIHVQAVLPCSPALIDSDRRYAGKANSAGRPAGARAWRLPRPDPPAPLRLVTTLFSTGPRALDRYDRATILSTTIPAAGSASSPRRDDGAETLGVNRALLRSQIYALLAIKPTGASVSPPATPTQLLDLFPTVLDLLELVSPSYPLCGQSACAPGAAPGRRASA